MSWSAKDVHELLLRWGVVAARMQDGGLGHASQVAWINERAAAPYRAIEPAEFMSIEIAAVDSALRELSQPLQVVVLCFYKPGHLRSAALDAGRALDRDGRGRQRSPSLRAIAGHLSISHETVANRLSTARERIAELLTARANPDRIEVTV